MDELLKVVFTGEVDCGKSTLIGRLLYDTDSISSQAKKELQKTCLGLGKEGLEFAYLLDSFQEEREGEFTLDTAQALIKTKHKEILLVDVPGHKALLKNMLTGASYADTAVLVVDIQKILEEQTKRHIYILNFLGINEMIVAVNKMDTVSYNEDNFIIAKAKAEAYLKDIGMRAQYIIPLSARDGENITKKSSCLGWYKGITLLETLNLLSKKELLYDFRFPVQDIYEIKKEKILLGTVSSGNINKRDLARVSPSGIELEIKKIKIFGKNKNSARAGESIGLIVSQFTQDLKRGQILYKGEPPVVASEIRARIFCLVNLNAQDDFILRISTQEALCRIIQINKKINGASLAEDPDLSLLNYTDIADVTLVTERPLTLEKFPDLTELGRFVIYKDNIAQAVGIIL